MSVCGLAFRDFPDAYMPDWIESLKRVEAMDFDVLVPGHGPLGTRANVTMFREYLEDLRGAVLRYGREGKSVDEMKQLIKGMYRLVQANRRGN
jgi:glyoxylase-like metal-dependent hydrolase (beta-lactamase superfamily II)